MRYLILLLIASLAFSQQICLTNPQGVTKCRAISADAWASAKDFQQASCKTPAPVEGQPVPIETCTYKSVNDVIFSHVEGYLRDLKALHPQAALTALKKQAQAANDAVKAEETKNPLGAEQ